MTDSGRMFGINWPQSVFWIQSVFRASGVRTPHRREDTGPTVTSTVPPTKALTIGKLCQGGAGKTDVATKNEFEQAGSRNA